MASWRNLHLSQNLKNEKEWAFSGRERSTCQGPGVQGRRGLTQDGMRRGLDHGEFQGEERGQERRPWGQAGPDHARPWTEEGSVILSSEKLLKGLWMGRAGMLDCDLVVPCSGCGTLGSLSASQGGLED